MSDRVETALLWLKRISFVIGMLITALGGGGSAVQYKLSPGAFGDAGVATDTIAQYTLGGVAVMVIGPAIAWGLGKLYAWKSGRRATPLLDFGFALGSVANLEHYLASRPADLVALAGIRKSVVEVYSALDQATATKVLAVKAEKVNAIASVQ